MTKTGVPKIGDGQIVINAEKTKGGYPLLRVLIGHRDWTQEVRLNTNEAWALLAGLEEQLRGKRD